MPKTASGKKAMKKFKKQYGDKEGEKIYYATANKQGRDEKSFKKESMQLVNDVMIEHNGNMISIPKGTPIREMVGTGAIAMVPNALGAPKKKKKKVKEASNSQVSTLNLKH